MDVSSGIGSFKRDSDSAGALPAHRGCFAPPCNQSRLRTGDRVLVGEGRSGRSDSAYPASTDQLENNHYDREHEQDVNEASDRGSGDQPEGPEYNQDDGDCKKHDRYSFGSEAGFKVCPIMRL